MPRQRTKTSAGKAPRVERTSEPRTETDMEQLGLVERLLLDRDGEIKPDRADRRFPGDPHAGARTDRGGVGEDRLNASRGSELGRRQDEVLLIVRPQRTKIGKHATAEPQLLGQAERDTERQRAEIVFVAAERVARDDIARPDAGRGKPAQIVAADKEAVLQQNLLSTPAEHIASFSRQAEHPFWRNRIVIAGAELVANVLDAKAGAGKIVADRGVVAARRFLSIVAPVIKQDLADRRGQMRSGLQLNE